MSTQSINTRPRPARKRRDLPYRGRSSRHQVCRLRFPQAGATHVLRAPGKERHLQKRFDERTGPCLALHQWNHAGYQSASGLEPVVTKALAEVDPDLTIVSVRTLEQQVALTFDRERAVRSLAGLFGIVALLLTAVGLYGVTGYSVRRRTSEIIRRAASISPVEALGTE